MGPCSARLGKECSAMCAYVQQCVLMFSNVCLCSTMCAYVQQCVLMFSTVCLCSAMSAYVQRSVLMFSNVCLCWALCAYVQHCGGGAVQWGTEGGLRNCIRAHLHQCPGMSDAVFGVLYILYVVSFYINPHQNDQGRKGPCFFQRLIALKCRKCQKI